MAIVYGAHDHQHRRRVAVKVLRPELVAATEGDRFLREIEIVAQLQHPHILPLYDSGQANDFLYYVMPLVEGESLADRIDRETQLPIDQAVQIAGQVADALAYAHTRNVVHRDVKPGNILLSQSHAIVADFGVARAITEAAGDRLTTSGLNPGTPLYAAPEQADGKVDERSDIYSLGCVLFEMLAGTPPFTGITTHMLLARHALEPPPRLTNLRPSIPPHLEMAVLKSLAKIPADRFSTAEEFGAALTNPSIVSGLSLDPGLFGSRTPTSVGTDHPALAIAVLPFTNVSTDADNEYFSDGITDELISVLTRVSGLRVASRTSAFSFKGKDADVRTIGHRLNVAVVVEGSVRRSGKTLRITAELTNVDDGYNIWAGTFEREMENVFAVQEDISRAIVDQLTGALVTETGATLVRRYTDNVEAYNLYLRGRYFWGRRTPEAVQSALRCYTEALAKDSEYALAYAGLADAYITLSQFQYVPPREVFPKAEEAARKALELDETLAEAQNSLAHVQEVYYWDWEKAEQDYVRALALNPNYGTCHAWYADFLMATGRVDESFAEMKRALELEPLSVPIASQAATLHLRARHYDEAIAQYQALLELDPQYLVAYLYLGFAYAYNGMLEKATITLRRAVEHIGPLPVFMAALGHVLGLAGENEQARGILEQLRSGATERYVPPAFFAVVHAGLNEVDDAFAWLEKSYEERSVILVWLGVEPYFDNLRRDPRFYALLKRMRLPDTPEAWPAAAATSPESA
jgi:serine/threonine-protein kinase